MGEYIVSARKYRPSTFKTVVGQKALTNTLKNAIDSRKLAQAYLFCGPRGVGKTSCARIFAKTINCLNPGPDGEACGECDSCRAIDQGNSFNIVELDAASNNSVDDIRRLTDEVSIPPQQGDYRVFIIDEVHMLSSQAFNAFLKTLEEPPSYVVFILATTEKHKVIPTILSRCQIYDFKRITTGDMVEHLAYVAEQEGIKAETEALNVIARKADGAMRDALSIFDQVSASTMGNITYQAALANLNVLDYDYYFALIEAFRAGDVASSLLILNQILEKGFDLLFFVNGLASHIRDLMMAADARTSQLLEIAEEIALKYHEQAKSLPLEWYYAALNITNDTDYKYRTASNKQLVVEVMLIRLCQLLNPPTAPFDRVEMELPLKKPVVDPSSVHSAAPVKAVEPKSEPESLAEPEKTVKESPKPVEPKTIEKETEPTKQKGEVDDNSAKEEPKPATKRKTSKLKSTRLSDLAAENVTSEKKEDKREAFSSESLKTAWNEYIEANQDKAMLVNAMKAGDPEKLTDEEYKVMVSHPAQKQAFEGNMNHLLEFIRARLSNDFFKLQVEIDDSVEIVKPLPPKELFKDILESNPTISDIVSRIDPELIL